MAEKVKFRIPASVAAYLRPGISSDEKLRGLSAAADMPPVHTVILIFSLMNDSDQTVKRGAAVAFAELSDDCLLKYIEQPDRHPVVLDAIARYHSDKPAVVSALLRDDALSSSASDFLSRQSPSTKEAYVPEERLGEEAEQQEEISEEEYQQLLEELSSEAGDEESYQEIDETAEDAEEFAGEEEHLSKYQMCQMMGIGEKIKMALTGDKEWRTILVKDANKLVSGGVLKNPRMTDGEVLTLLKAGVQNDEIIRLICANKEWIKNYQIRKALVENPRTPVANAIRYLNTLGDKDIAGYAKSKNISSVISTQAKRMLLNKKR